MRPSGGATSVSYTHLAKNINSIPLIRYAEVLLNYAEAQAELGVITDSEWALTVGALRKRCLLYTSRCV